MKPEIENALIKISADMLTDKLNPAYEGLVDLKGTLGCEEFTEVINSRFAEEKKLILNIAVVNGDTTIVSFLLDSGADALLCDARNRSAQALAENYRYNKDKKDLYDLIQNRLGQNQPIEMTLEKPPKRKFSLLRELFPGGNSLISETYGGTIKGLVQLKKLRIKEEEDLHQLAQLSLTPS